MDYDDETQAMRKSYIAANGKPFPVKKPSIQNVLPI